MAFTCPPSVHQNGKRFPVSEPVPPLFFFFFLRFFPPLQSKGGARGVDQSVKRLPPLLLVSSLVKVGIGDRLNDKGGEGENLGVETYENERWGEGKGTFL